MRLCHEGCINFVVANIRSDEVKGKTVLEVGARAVQGPTLMIRPWIERLGPAAYLGVDIEPGLGVDELCSAESICERFGRDAFDVVVATELLEHVRDWRSVVTNVKNVVRPGGVLLITTRSYGFRFHGYPSDYWRFEVDDMRVIFSDFPSSIIERDPVAPGVFFKGVKPVHFREVDLFDYPLRSILTGTRRATPPPRLIEAVVKVGLTTRGLRRVTTRVTRGPTRPKRSLSQR
jgi:SAM-dependent methyltransferase